MDIIKAHYRRYLESNGYTGTSLRDYLLSLDMFERVAGSSFLKSVVLYRDFHFIVEDLSSRTEWPDGRAKKRWGQRMTKKVADELTVFFRWAKAFGFTEHDPLKDGNQFRKSAGKPPEFFDWDDPQFKKILYDPNNSVRFSTILHVLRASGVRAAELCNLKKSDVSDGVLRVSRGKGGNPRFVGVDQECKTWLDLYLRHLSQHYDGEWLFPKEDFSGSINPHGLWKMVYNKGRKLGIKIHPHKIRHSFPAEAAFRGMNMLAISNQMGHSDPRTTMHYTHLNAKKASAEYQKAFQKIA